MSAPRPTPPQRPQRPPSNPGFASSVRRIVPIAWPVFIGQVAVLAFATVDTVLVARAIAVC